MINPLVFYEDLYATMRNEGLSLWAEHLRGQLEHAFDANKHGHLDDWRAALAQLPQISPSQINLSTGAIQVGVSQDCDATTQKQLAEQLQVFHPWRKGPYDMFGVYIDTEWRSDWKWDRLKDHIEDLQGRVVLDVGCGSGYHCWRMAGAGAKLVIGIDPFMVYTMQYQVLRTYLPEPPVYVLPLGIEQLPHDLNCFDTAFSMGVLYHRKSPHEHLSELYNCLRPQGELVLETLIINGDGEDELVPKGRYAKMRNVYSIPSCGLLERWLKAQGFDEIRLLDVTKTSLDEQRTTDWMRFESLADFLDPSDPDKSIEGYPAPLRATYVAKKP